MIKKKKTLTKYKFSLNNSKRNFYRYTNTIIVVVVMETAKLLIEYICSIEFESCFRIGIKKATYGLFGRTYWIT